MLRLRGRGYSARSRQRQRVEEGNVVAEVRVEQGRVDVGSGARPVLLAGPAIAVAAEAQSKGGGDTNLMIFQFHLSTIIELARIYLQGWSEVLESH